jgi:bifunctional DNA-binding transcriptional regulator/antitoxin component of YhaV-PrlF toxin-antitoxin module
MRDLMKWEVTSMETKQTFRAVIESEGGGGAYVNIPFDVEQVYGKKRVKVKALIDGEPYRGSLTRMGGDCHILIVLKEIREKIGKSSGDEVEVTVEEDMEPRVVEVPQDLTEELARHPEANTYFQKLSYSHQKEYVDWIEGAKREQTRLNRIGKAIVMLSAGKKAR